MANKRSELALFHSALSFQALVSGAGTEREPKRLPELTWSCESGKTSVTLVHGTENQNDERYTEPLRSAQVLP